MEIQFVTLDKIEQIASEQKQDGFFIYAFESGCCTAIFCSDNFANIQGFCSISEAIKWLKSKNLEIFNIA
jgi:hypothetical protein